jgi:hypothetical protein
MLHAAPLACLPAGRPACRPAGLPARLPARLPACLPACLPAWLPACLPGCLPACLPAWLPACLPACLPAPQPYNAAVARAQVRAKRRYDELLLRGVTASYGAVLADMAERDARDSSRAAAPLRPAEDAFVLDTTDMAAAHVLAAARAFVQEKLAAASAAAG